MVTDLRNLEITSQRKELVVDPNRQIWQSLGIKQSESVLFFPTPNVLVPIAFAKFMNKRKVTFADPSEINVSTLIALAAELKLSNVTVKLVGPAGKFPIEDSSFDLVYSDWGYSAFQDSSLSKGVDADALTKELIRILKTDGRLVALDESGPVIMYPCPQEMQAIRSKVEAGKAERYLIGRRIYGLFKANGLKNVKLSGYSKFVTKDDEERLDAELTRRIQMLDSSKEGKSGLTLQEIDKYKQWLRAQRANDSFILQFNSILTEGQKK